jgi:TolB protein
MPPRKRATTKDDDEQEDWRIGGLEDWRIGGLGDCYSTHLELVGDEAYYRCTRFKIDVCWRFRCDLRMRDHAEKARFLLVAFLVLALRPSLCAEPGTALRRIAFARDSTIWTANADGTEVRKLIRGADPSISPDGTKVAFTMSPSGGKEVLRFIAVADVATGATKIFKATPSSNSFGPVWSPDGSQILFEIFVENHWRLGLVNADGSEFRFFKMPSLDLGWWSAIWAPDARSIFCQDLEKIYQFGLNGVLLNSWEISKVIPHGDMDSSKRLSISADGKRLLIDVNMDEEASLKDWEGPPPAIWLFDIASAKATRLTPKKSYASDSCWLSDVDFLLVDADKGGKTNSIYRASIGGWMPRLLIKNAANPSVSNSQ